MNKKPATEKPARKVAAKTAAARPAAAKKPSAAAQRRVEQVVESFRACAPVFDALGDRHRQDIVMLLALDERLNVNGIAERMPLSRPAISHHLKVLLQAGLVVQERVSREHFYSLALDPALAAMRRLVEQAEAICAEQG